MKRLTLISALVLLPLLAAGQGKDWGSLSGGLESNSVLYRDWSFRSNNYVKLDYAKGRFSAGFQAEYYPTPLLGYSQDLKGFKLPGLYFAWTDAQWSVTAGSFFEQFGTGVLLRSWEDRNLGWNNALGGLRATFRTKNDLFSIKAFAASPRLAASWLNQPLLMTGGEASLNIGVFSLQASVLGNQTLTTEGRGPMQVSWSALAGVAVGGFSSRFEYVGRPGGNAQSLELHFAASSFSSALTVRRLKNMLDPLGMNYLPALCQEHSYMLASLNPYTTYEAGEFGGSLDLFYRIDGWKFHVNGSYIWSLPSALRDHTTLRMGYRDLNVQVEKRWNKRLKTIAYLSIQENSPSHGQRKATNAQNVFVLDGVYRFPGKLSLRAQVQYLYSEELTKDWMAGSLELSSTDGWAVHVQDMYNHGSTKEHYYEAGGSWTHSGFKVSLAYGHQRAGMVCSGGVCRWQPEYTGAILRLNYHF